MLFLFICLAIFIDAVLYGAIIPILPAFAQTHNISADLLCYIFAVYPLSILIFSFHLGIFADRKGRRPVMIAGLIVMAVATLILAQAQTVTIFVISRFLQGLAGAATWTAGLAWICDIFPAEKRGEKIGIASIASGVGLCVGPVMGGIFGQWYGHAMLFYILAAVVLLLGIYFVVVPTRGIIFMKTVSQKIPWNNPALILACLSIIAGITGLGLFEPLLSLYVIEYFHADKIVVGALFGTISVAYIISQPLFGKLSDRFGRKIFIFVGFLMTAVLSPLITWVNSLELIFVLGCFLGVGFGLMLTPAMTLLSEAFDENGAAYGLSAGFYNISFAIGLVLGPLFGGVVYQQIGYTGVFTVYAAMMLAGGIAAFRLQMPEKTN